MMTNQKMIDSKAVHTLESHQLAYTDILVEGWENLLIDPPAPEEIKTLRESLGLTQSQAAYTVGITDRALWAKYESGIKTPSKFTWTTFLLLTKKHPIFTLEDRM